VTSLVSSGDEYIQSLKISAIMRKHLQNAKRETTQVHENEYCRRSILCSV